MFIPKNNNTTQVANAIARVLTYREDLIEAKRSVPSYTGDMEPKEYYAEEQREYLQAADDLVTELKLALRIN